MTWYDLRKRVAVIAPAIIGAGAVLLLSGCGDFFAQKPTEVQAREILEELGQVRESPHIHNPLPEVYRQPPARLQIREGTKLFYFTKHHPAGNLAGLVKEQLGVDASVNAAINQLVLYCADDAQATAVEDYLRLIDVPPVQVNIDCLILERFGDITMDWETSVMIQNLLGEGITLGEDRGTFIKKIGDNSYRFVDGRDNLLPGNVNVSNYAGIDFDKIEINERVLVGLDPAFPGASLREPERGKFGLDFGYWRNRGVPGHQFRAVVDVLISKGYLKVLLNPTLETVNAQPAAVTIKDHAPIEVVKTGLGGASSVYNITEYVWVENTLSVTPHVYADGSIGLVTDIKIGSRSKPEGVVQRAIITERSINVAENRILPGESLIIGGMRKMEKRSVIRGIPFFKDLPLLGVLFSSKDFEEKATEIIYILTPSISAGGEDHGRVVQEIRDKYAESDYKTGLRQMLTEPFEPSIYSSLVEQKAVDAELQRKEAELAREEAMRRAQAERQRADRIAVEAEKLRQKAEQLRREADKAAQDAQQAIEKARQAAELTEAERQRIMELQQQKDAAEAEAQNAQQQAEQAARAAQQAAQQAQQAAEQLEQSRQAAQQAQEQAENAQREAQALEQEQAAEPQEAAPPAEQSDTEQSSPSDTP